MGLMTEVRKSARRVRDEADTQMQLARRYAEQVNLQRARKDVLAEVGAEVLDAARDGEATSIALSPRGRALLEEARRIERDMEVVREDIDRLKRGSTILGANEPKGAVRPKDVETPADAAAPTPADVRPGTSVPEGAGAGAPGDVAATHEQEEGKGGT